MSKGISWRDASLGTKLSVSNFFLVALVFGIFVAAIGYAISSVIETRATAEVQEKTNLLVKLIETADKDMRARTGDLAKKFQTELKGKFELEAPAAHPDPGKKPPVLTLDGKPLNQDFVLVDRFLTYAGSVATVFARSGEDLVRITTSLKKADGERAMGTLLDHNHPGYARLLEGKSYTGPAKLFGNDYLTQYDPITDSAGKVIGATFVALNVTNYMAELKASIQELKIGSSGYFYVLDSSLGKDRGAMLIHPTLAGKNVLDLTDTDGRSIFKEMLDQKKGSFVYHWIAKERGETGDVPLIVEG